MKATVETIREIVKVLTPEEQQLLKDTFLFGGWGDTETEFLNEEGKTETVGAWGYCTNDAREGKHFAGRVVSTMFRSIYRKLCTANRNQIGAHLSHCNDWWGDGNGDMLFVRSAWNKAWLEWAKEPLQPAEEPKSEEKPAVRAKLISTATGNNGFQVSFAEDRDGVEMTVKKSQGANGIAVTYTLDQLRQLSDAINEYLHCRPLTGAEVHMPRRVGLYRYDHGVDKRWFALGYFKSVGAAILSAFDNATRYGLNKPDVWTLIRETDREMPPVPDGPRPADEPGFIYSINRQIK